MLEYCNYFFKYIRILLTLGFISYLYNWFYCKCNQDVRIKTKNGHIKTVTKTKICLSLSYFVLINILYYNLTWRVLLTLTSFILIVGLYFADKYYFDSKHLIYKFDNNSILRFNWKIFSTIITLVFLIYEPIYDTINKLINDKIKNIKFLFNKLLLGNYEDVANVTDVTDVMKIFNKFDENRAIKSKVTSHFMQKCFICSAVKI